MFIAKQNDLIVQAADTREELERKIKFLAPPIVIEETEETLKLVQGRFVNAEEEQELEHERIQQLRMTPLDFLKALETYAGITYEQIKTLCDSSPEVDRELRFCQNIYRNNEMLSQLAPQFNVTEEQLDNIFDTVDKMKRQALLEQSQQDV